MLDEEAETKQKADMRSLYMELVLSCCPDERSNGKLQLQMQSAFQDFISTVPVTERLPKCVVRVLNDVEEPQASKIAQVFDALEAYALNLWDFPWKKDFRHISTYSGFYKTRLEPYVDEPDRLLRVLGYERTSDDELKLIGRLPSKQTLSRAAFNFFLCAVECRTSKSTALNVLHEADKIQTYAGNVDRSSEVRKSTSCYSVDENRPAGRDKIQQNRGDVDAHRQMSPSTQFGNEKNHIRPPDQPSVNTPSKNAQLLPGSTILMSDSESQKGILVAQSTCPVDGYLDSFDSR